MKHMSRQSITCRAADGLAKRNLWVEFVHFRFMHELFDYYIEVYHVRTSAKITHLYL